MTQTCKHALSLVIGSRRYPSHSNRGLLGQECGLFQLPSKVLRKRPLQNNSNYFFLFLHSLLKPFTEYRVLKSHLCSSGDRMKGSRRFVAIRIVSAHGG